MVKKGAHKLMWLEGVDTLLYDIEADPNERDNLAEDKTHADTRKQLESILFDGFEPDSLTATISLSQRQRLQIHRATGGEPTNVNIVRTDDDDRYIRNAGAADTKAKARLPYVAAAKPDAM